MSSSVDSVAGTKSKSPEAFRTISEVSEELDLPQHVLRFWETRFAQIKPMKRGGGRRLYRPDHVALLRGIKALLYDDGMTIKGVQKLLREGQLKPTTETSASVIAAASRTGQAPSGSIKVEELSGLLRELKAIRDMVSKA